MKHGLKLEFLDFMDPIPASLNSIQAHVSKYVRWRFWYTEKIKDVLHETLPPKLFPEGVDSALAL